ncbi:MAG TPA: siderophore-interacting protein [Nocardioides sp.]|nr:siderophore-interacting protein [Nocardioides sp.]
MPLLATVSVRATERISPSFVRLVLGGPDLADLGVDGPTYDQRFKLHLPCGTVRTYTIRDVRGSGAETRIVLDVVLHPGEHGPGSAWAASAAVGDEVKVLVPRRGQPFGGIEWDPGAADRLLLVADETAVPAVASILGALPGDARGAAFLEVPTPADLQDLRAPAGFSITWLPRSGAPVGSRVVAAVGEHLGFAAAAGAADEVDPDLWETPTYSSSGETLTARPARDGRYAWVAGESGMVTALRRHLVRDLGLPRQQVAFMGYWRRGVAMRS